MEYVATRDGVEIIQSTESATKKQKQFIKKLLKDFPDAKELFEYSDYLQTPNRGTASAFIAVALDTHLHEVESESGYMSYIAQRPRAEKHGGHGLFSEVDTTDLKAAKAELDAHVPRRGASSPCAYDGVVGGTEERVSHAGGYRSHAFQDDERYLP